MTKLFECVAILIMLSLFSPIKSDQKYVECNFTSNDCGIKNGPDMATQFAYGRAQLANRNQNMMYLDISKATTSGARLVTPYYHTYNELYACLTIDWYSSGVGQQSLSVTQQDKRDVKLWASYVKSAQWRINTINVDLRGGDLRFFIEAHFEPRTTGIIAIDRIRLDYHKC